MPATGGLRFTHPSDACWAARLAADQDAIMAATSARSVTATIVTFFREPYSGSRQSSNRYATCYRKPERVPGGA
jgi:hypothetical protein